jgi:hypothetical protein
LDGGLLGKSKGRATVMLHTQYLLNHIDALLRLSHDVKDRAVSAELREMADEFRIMVSVADVTDFAAALTRNAAAPLHLGVADAAAVPTATLGVREDPKDPPLLFFGARYPRLTRTLACQRVGAP